MPKDFILFAIISLPSEHNIQFGQTDVRLNYEARAMERNDYFRIEEECEFRFRELGPCYHLCTSENAPILFHNEGDFKTAMNIIALASKLFPDIKILTFEVMNNHLHFALCGNENRNGYVADSGHTPFSYPWGANRFFFNGEAKCRYESLKIMATARWKRSAFHSNLGDNLTGLNHLDGYVSPMCFCHIRLAEGLFINAHQFFSKITKSVESSAVIAKEIGESVFYTDNELFSIISQKCYKQYGCKSPAMIPAEAKVTVAKMMHFDYNSSDKQISRILKMEIDTVRRMFPEL